MVFKNYKRSVVLGVSMALSWAWGVSLVVGLTIIMERGTIPFILWASANSLAIPLFGWVAYRLPQLERIIRHPVMKYIMIIIQVFALWVQCQAIFEISMMAGMTDFFAKLFSVVIGLLFVALVMRDGLNRAIFTHQFQGSVIYLGLFVLIIWGVFNSSTSSYSLIAPDSFSWAVWSCIILFSGPFMDLQQWQRAKVAFHENERLSFLFAALAFSGYMTLIYFTSYFEFSKSMMIILLIVTIMIATSTINSAAVALQGSLGTKLGVGIAFISIAVYPFIVTIGLLQLWTLYGSIRVYIVFVILVLAIFVLRKKTDVGEINFTHISKKQ